MTQLVAIILINYHGQNDTIECIKSLMKIDYNNYKIVVVNNDEVDSGELLNELSKNAEFSKIYGNTLFYLYSGGNIGFSGGNNCGIDFAAEKFNPDFYLLINNDTTVERDFLTKLVQGALKFPDANLYSGKIMYYSTPSIIWYAGGEYDRSTGWTHHFGANEQDCCKFDEIRSVSFATGCLWLLPKKTIENVGKLSEDYFLYSEDTDYCCRVIDNGGTIIYIPESVIYHKVSASTGKISDLQQYYYVRNDLLCVSKYCRRKTSIIWKHIIIYCGSIIKGNKKLRAVCHAIRDYIHNRNGRNLEL